MPSSASKVVDLKQYQPVDSMVVLGDFIAEGGFSEVFKAQYQGQSVAVKKMLVPKPANLPRAMEILANEIAILCALPPHENIIKLIAPCSDALLLEFADRGDLQSALTSHNENRSLLSFADRLEYSVQIVRGVSHVHAYDVILMDLKEENILLTSNGRVLLTDFAFAKQLNGAQSILSTQGSFFYFSPEKLWDRISSKKSDIYALALIFWAMLSGMENNYDFETLEELEAAHHLKKRPSLVNTEFNNLAFAFLIFSLWREDPDDRLTADEALNKVTAIQEKYLSLHRNRQDRSQKYIPPALRGNFPMKNHAKLLHAAVVDGSLDVIKLVFSHPDFKAAWLTDTFYLPSNKKISPFLLAIRTDQPAIVKEFLSHKAASKDLFLLQDDFSGKNAITEMICNLDCTFIYEILNHSLVDEAVFASLFDVAADKSWHALINTDSVVLESTGYDAESWCSVMFDITQHPFFTLRDLKVLIQNVETEEISANSPLGGTPFFKIYSLLEKAANADGQNRFFTMISTEYVFAKSHLQENVCNLRQLCQALMGYAESNPPTHYLTQAIILAKEYLQINQVVSTLPNAANH